MTETTTLEMEGEFPVETPIPVETADDRATPVPDDAACVVIRPRNDDGQHPVEFQDATGRRLKEGIRTPDRIRQAYDAASGVGGTYREPAEAVQPVESVPTPEQSAAR